jgi:hypothetical protein
VNKFRLLSFGKISFDRKFLKAQNQIMGFGTLILILVFAGAIYLSIFKRQAFAGWVAGIGLLSLAYWGLSVAFGNSYPILALPYRAVNIYVFLFLAVIFTVAGGIGLLVRIARKSNKE